MSSAHFITTIRIGNQNQLPIDRQRLGVEIHSSWIFRFSRLWYFNSMISIKTPMIAIHSHLWTFFFNLHSSESEYIIKFKKEVIFFSTKVLISISLIKLFFTSRYNIWWFSNKFLNYSAIEKFLFFIIQYFPLDVKSKFLPPCHESFIQ